MGNYARKPLRYYSRKRSLSSPAASRLRFGTRPINKYDSCTKQELYDLYERARAKLEALPTGAYRLYNMIVADIHLLQSSKNWVK